MNDSIGNYIDKLLGARQDLTETFFEEPNIPVKKQSNQVSQVKSDSTPHRAPVQSPLLLSNTLSKKIKDCSSQSSLTTQSTQSLQPEDISIVNLMNTIQDTLDANNVTANVKLDQINSKFEALTLLIANQQQQNEQLFMLFRTITGENNKLSMKIDHLLEQNQILMTSINNQSILLKEDIDRFNNSFYSNTSQSSQISQSQRLSNVFSDTASISGSFYTAQSQLPTKSQLQSRSD